MVMSDAQEKGRKISDMLLEVQNELYCLHASVPELVDEYGVLTVDYILDNLNRLRHEIAIALSIADQINRRMT